MSPSAAREPFGRVVRHWRRLRFGSSARYWERRYLEQGTSGAGSYGAVASFKADTLNAFVAEHAVRSVLEFGCGDGNQLSMAHYPRYVGLDVSATAVRRCAELFRHDPTKSFLRYDPEAFVNRGALQADLVLSLDVVLHLVEDEVFYRYVEHVFEAAQRYVAFFAEDFDEVPRAAHVRYRDLPSHVARTQPEWQLVGTAPNPHKGTDSRADFWFYARDDLPGAAA